MSENKDNINETVESINETTELGNEAAELGDEPVKKEKKKRPLRAALIIILIVLVALLMAVFAYAYPKLKKMNISSLEEEAVAEVTLSPDEIMAQYEEEEVMSTTTALPTAEPTPEVTAEPVLEMKNNEDYGIINIMVFGMDNRYRKTILGGRSDVNIILTIDTVNNEVRLTSIMRDTLVYLPSKNDYNRVNAAIVYEDGPEGAIQVIEDEFLVDIDHYIITSFRGMIEIIDAIGGVEVTVSQTEMWAMNGLIEEMNLLFGNSASSYQLSSYGTRTLNGVQAVAYMRIRKDDGVFMRVARQQEVLASAKENLASMSLTDLDEALNTVVDWVKTDMEPLELIAMAKTLYDMRDAELKTARVPYDGLYESVRYEGMAVLQYEKEETLWKMQDFIYYGIE